MDAMWQYPSAQPANSSYPQWAPLDVPSWRPATEPGQTASIGKMVGAFTDGTVNPLDITQVVGKSLEDVMVDTRPEVGAETEANDLLGVAQVVEEAAEAARIDIQHGAGAETDDNNPLDTIQVTQENSEAALIDTQLNTAAENEANNDATTTQSTSFDDGANIAKLGLMRAAVSHDTEKLAKGVERSKKNYRYRRAALLRKQSAKLGRRMERLMRIDQRLRDGVVNADQPEQVDATQEQKPDYFAIAVSLGGYTDAATNGDQQVAEEFGGIDDHQHLPSEIHAGQEQSMQELQQPLIDDSDYEDAGPVTVTRRKQHKPMSAQQQMSTLSALESKLARGREMQQGGSGGHIGGMGRHTNHAGTTAGLAAGGATLAYPASHAGAHTTPPRVSANRLPTPPGSTQKPARCSADVSFSPPATARKSPESNRTSDVTQEPLPGSDIGEGQQDLQEHRCQPKLREAQDIAVSSRLAIAVVMLELADTASVDAVRQYAAELCGGDVWTERLAYYVDCDGADSSTNSAEKVAWAKAHLGEVADMLEPFDGEVAERFDALIEAI